MRFPQKIEHIPIESQKLFLLFDGQLDSIFDRNNDKAWTGFNIILVFGLR